MNIVKEELRVQIKRFLYWTIGLGVLIFVGTAKFQGISGANGESIAELMSYYPKVLLAMLGMPQGIDIGTLSGYQGILAYYSLICVCIYAIFLGNGVIGREMTDQTYEFLFTKPRSRRSILAWKIIGAAIPLTAYCILNYWLTRMALTMITSEEIITNQVELYGITTYLIGLIFYGFTILCSTILVKSERASVISFALFFVSFFLGGIYDVAEEAHVLRIFTPLRYFTYTELASNNLPIEYLVISLAILTLSIICAFQFFQKRDLL
ncbi:MAG: ABC transporter permease subunit [Eubacteriales bacterium]